MEHFVYKDENELTHWGVRGMRWGIRRYQNKDGSLTKAGQKRYNDELAAVRKEEKTLKNRKSVQNKLDKLAARKKAVEDDKKQFDEEQKKNKHGNKNAEQDAANAAKKEAKKSIKDLGDEELAYKIRRAQLEKQYESLIAEPEPAAKGNGFVKDFMNKSAVPAIQEAGKQLIRDSLLKMGKKYLGLENDVTVKTVDKLKEEWETLNYTDKINTLKNKAANAAEKERQKQAEAAAKAAEKERQKQDEAARVANEARSREEYERSASSYHNKGTSNTTSQTKTSDSSEKKVYTGTVEGVGTSTRNKGRKWTTDRVVYDADYTEIVDDDNTSSGRSYVSNYLSLPAPRLGLPAPRDDD